MKIISRHLASIFKRLSLNVSKQLFSVIGQLVAKSRFKPLKRHVTSKTKVMHFWHSIFAYQLSLYTFKREEKSFELVNEKLKLFISY